MRRPRVEVAVSPPSAIEREHGVLRALEQLMAVRFTAESRVAGEPDAVLRFGSGGEPALGPRVPQLTLLGSGNRGDGDGGDRDHSGDGDGDGGRAAGRVRDVRIAAPPGVDRRLHQTTFFGQTVGAPLSGGEALALGPDGPAWSRVPGPVRTDRVAVGLPQLASGATLLEALHGERSLALIALIDFLRAVGAARHTSAGLRCAFVFDDPNLRCERYGHIDYRALAAHADAHCYHASMAMVPLDARLHGDGAVRLFRERADRLSLTMHGNNHTASELMVLEDFSGALALGAQSLRRVGRFEARTGLRVDRVMMPPHGGWSRACARALGGLGYDALCTTQHSPPSERVRELPVLAGAMPAQFVDGCAVVPRLPLNDAPPAFAIRAFLGAPLILYGHHGDLAGGLQPLAAAAELINRMGEVRWCSVGEIVESNYDWRIEDDTLVVRPWSGRLRIRVPDSCQALRVECPIVGSAADAGLAGWRFTEPSGPRRSLGEAAAVAPGEHGVCLISAWQTDPRAVARPARRPAAIVRRRLSEARDQLAR